jgi:hypothetical protein
MLRTSTFLVALAFAAAAFARDLPDPNLTPGVTNPQVTHNTIKDTICKKGWTKSVRPPVSFTDSLKVKQIAQYHYTDTNPAHYEEDHLIALELGGAPQNEKNLWPQPRSGTWTAKMKDDLENVLNKRVCSGKMTLADAQKAIRTDWTAAYRKYVTLAAKTKKGP